MSEEKKPRNMTEKGFLHKSGRAVSPAGFLAQHREWLLTGQLAVKTVPILEKLDRKEILPTPALIQVRAAVLNHMTVQELEKAQKKASEEKQPSSGYTAMILDSVGNVATRINSEGEIEDLIKGFNLPQEAARWTDRRLFDGAPDWTGKITHQASSITEVVERSDAIARILKKPVGATTKAQSKTTERLSFGAKVSQDRCHFSKG